MSRVSWSEEALADLEFVVEDLSVRKQLMRNAEETLHKIPRHANPADEGAEGEIMWRRAITREQERQRDAGMLPEPEDGAQTWNYFLFYREQKPGKFEVLAVRSIYQVASRWMRTEREIADADADVAG